MRERRNRITRSLTRVTRWPLACVALAFVIGIHSPSLAQVQAPVHHPRVLRFSGVPMTEASLIRNKFPFVFEREVSLSEIDEIVRWLMSTGHYSNIEVVERDTSSGTRELVLLANVLRHIQNITIDGNHLFAKSEVSQILNISEGQIFERKELLAAADELRNSYERAGYHNARVEIDFKLPNDTQVEIHVTVNEGTPLRVSDLTVETVNDDLTQRLKRYARRLKGRTLNSTSLIDFEKSVSEYLQQNRYLIAKISSPSITYSSDRTEAKISYSVDSPWRYEFFFNGNNFLSEGSLIDRFDLDKFSGSISSPAPDLAEKIRRVYQSSGFTNVEVTYREKTLETLYKRQITFDIKEGARVRIRKIAINGTISRPEEYYASFMKASSSDLIGEGYYNRKDIDDGAKRLIKELQNQGYLRARVQSQRADFSKDKTNVTIHLQIDEGPLTQIREIRFDGATAFARVELLNSLKIKTGAALGLQELEDSIQQLKEFYRDAGYLEMKITNENERDRIVTYNDTNTQATVTFQIFEGPKVIVQGIALEGNSFTKDFVIERELKFKTGDVLTPKKIDDTVFNLQSLGLFSKVEIHTSFEQSNVSERTVIVKVGERDPGSFVVGFGINNDNSTALNVNYRGYLGVNYRNLMGTGRAVSLRGDVNYRSDPSVHFLENRITASYLEPYIWGTKNRGRINLIRDQHTLPGIFVPGTDHAEIFEANTVGLLLERDIARHIKLTFTGYSFSTERTFDRVSGSTIDGQNIAKIGPLVEFDYRDDAFNPSKGSYSYFSLEYSDPIFGSTRNSTQTINFVKTNIATTVYTPLNRSHRVVWANSLRNGYVANVSRRLNSGVPVQEGFFLGSRSTIRGFDGQEPNRIPNQQELGVGPGLPLTDLTQFKIKNDSYYYLIKTELRFPLWKTSPMGDLSGALFYDGGAVLIHQAGVDIPDSYRDTIGFGVRIATPVGPASLDYGLKLDRKRDPNESPGAFHFSIGVF